MKLSIAQLTMFPLNFSTSHTSIHVYGEQKKDKEFSCKPFHSAFYETIHFDRFHREGATIDNVAHRNRQCFHHYLTPIDSNVWHCIIAQRSKWLIKSAEQLDKSLTHLLCCKFNFVSIFCSAGEVNGLAGVFLKQESYEHQRARE